MAGSIKGITVEIGGDATKLDKALQGVNTKSKDLQSELRQVEKLLKLDPTNVTLVAQKQQLLTQAVDNTSQKLSTLKEAERQAQEQFQKGEISEEQYRALQREIVSTEQKLNGYEAELKEVGTESKKTADATDNIGKQADEAGKKTKGMSAGSVAGFAALAAAATATIAAVTRIANAVKDSVNSLAEYADDIATMSNKFHVSTDTLQEFAYAAELVDVDINTFGSSLGKLTKNINAAENGTRDQVAAFQALGVSYRDDVTGQLRDSEDVFYDVIDALGNVSNETQADIYANSLFGRSFQDLNPLVAAGSERLKELGVEAHSLGVVMSGAQLNKINAYKDAMDKLKYQVKMAAVPFVDGLIPAMESTYKMISQKLASPSTQAMLKKLGETIGNVIQDAANAFFEFANFMEKHGREIITIVGAIGAGFLAFNIAGIVDALKNSITALIPQLAAAKAGQDALNVSMTANPYGIIAAAVAGVVVVLSSLISKSMELDEETQKIVDSSKALTESMAQSRTDYTDTSAKITAQTAVAEDLVTKLDKLNEKTALTSSEQAQMKLMIDQLNGIYPDLNLAIDEQTGKLNKSTSEIRSNVSALKTQASELAKQEALTRLIKEMSDAEVELALNQSRREEILKDLTEAEKEQVEWISQNNEIIPFTADAYARLSPEMKSVVDSLNALNAENINLNEQMGLTNTTIQSFTTGNQTAAQSVEELKTAEEEQIAAQQAATEEIKALYEARVTAATDAFNRISEGESISVQDMIDNLNSNADALQDWTTNINTLATTGLDKGFLQTLRDKGPEAAAQVQAMVDYMKKTGDTSFKDFNQSLMRATSAGVNSVSGIMLDDESTSIGSKFISANAQGTQANLELKAAASNQVVDTKIAMRGAIVASDFPRLGGDIISDMVTGLNNAKESLLIAARAIAADLKAALTIKGTISATATGSRTVGIDVNWNASGAYFDKPTILPSLMGPQGVGERGAEIIAPMAKLESMMISAAQNTGGGRTVNVNIYPQNLSDAQIRRVGGLLKAEWGMEY